MTTGTQNCAIKSSSVLEELQYLKAISLCIISRTLGYTIVLVLKNAKLWLTAYL